MVFIIPVTLMNSADIMLCLSLSFAISQHYGKLKRHDSNKRVTIIYIYGSVDEEPNQSNNIQ